MKPIISAKGKTTHLRYELPQRIYDTKVYPVKALNGSTVILSGQEGGVGIIWRGGRPLKKPGPPPKQPIKPPQKVNGTKDAIMIIDSDDEEPAKAAPTPVANFEDEEEELDPDQPYPSFVQQIRLSLNTDVLHIAVPPVAASGPLPPNTTPPIFGKKIVFAITCTDFSVRIITLPLNPPPDAAAERSLSTKSLYGEEVTRIPTLAGHQTIPRGVSITWTSKADSKHKQSSENEMDIDDEGEESAGAPGRRSPRKKQSQTATGEKVEGFDLLVASHSYELGGLLKLWRFGLTETSVKATNPISPYQTLTLRKAASRVAFNTAQYPKSRHSQLLITDASGNARIYDPFAVRKRDGTSGAFIALFNSPFSNAKTNAPSLPILATRKGIMDAAWTSDGRHVLALLSDGEWGVWDVDRSGPGPSANPSAFSLRGYVGISDNERASSGASSPKSRTGRSSLAPMTPNTRRRKEETLFHGSSSSSIPTRGGISVASSPPSINGNAAEDSVIIWYGIEIHRIPDLAKYWTRTMSSNDGFSPQEPALSQMHDAPLLGESITSIAQFDASADEKRMGVSSDVLIGAEHRLILAANTSKPFGRDLNAIFAREQAEEKQARKTDQALLAHGELDLGGMDRLLGDMEGSGSRSMVLGNSRKVLFASSTT